MTGDSKKPLVEEMNSIYKEPKEIRLMSYKILVEKFNQKYGNLSQEQKTVLREYIENVSNTNNLKSFLQKESKRVKSILEQKTKKISDKALKIKLSEVISLLDSYDTIKNVDENHISALMRYYDLVNDL
jgi:capsid portal protein